MKIVCFNSKNKENHSISSKLIERSLEHDSQYILLLNKLDALLIDTKSIPFIFTLCSSLKILRIAVLASSNINYQFSN